MPITTQQEEKSSKAGSRVRETLFPHTQITLENINSCNIYSEVLISTRVSPVLAASDFVSSFVSCLLN